MKMNIPMMANFTSDHNLQGVNLGKKMKPY